MTRFGAPAERAVHSADGLVNLGGTARRRTARVWSCQLPGHPRPRTRPPQGASCSPAAQDAALQDLIRELEHPHPRKNTFPGEIFLRLAADALARCGASLADPLPLEGMRERFLPEFSGRGRGSAQAPVRGARSRGAARRRRTGPAR